MYRVILLLRIFFLLILCHPGNSSAGNSIFLLLQFAGFDPFERSTYFGPFFDLGQVSNVLFLLHSMANTVCAGSVHLCYVQFERFRRIFHHSTYRVLLGHKERKILSCLFVEEVKSYFSFSSLVIAMEPPVLLRSFTSFILLI